jgi:hypothetical protein
VIKKVEIDTNSENLVVNCRFGAVNLIIGGVTRKI